MQTVYVAGHTGMVGSAICKRLEQDGLLVLKKTSKELDLRDQLSTNTWLQESKPDAVIIAAAKVGGIHANNTYPAEFIYDNLTIASNLIHSSYKAGIKKLIFLGSSCIYPKFAEQPIQEISLLTSSLEPTNEAYAIAKIAALKLCQYYRKQYNVDYHSVMPCNLFGEGDNYHPDNSHVLPGLIKRFHEAKINNKQDVTMWGTGTPLREFLFADDLAKIIVKLLAKTDLPDWLNIGSDDEYTIRELAEMVKNVVGFEGDIILDSTKPDGTPRKKTDNTLLKNIVDVDYTEFTKGLELAYKDFLRRYTT